MIIASLNKNQVFVFGSNLAGIHGAGAAKTARFKFGAKLGVGEGLTGQSYALPTKDRSIRTMSLEKINEHVMRFLKFASDNPSKEFLVTCIGCGLAGYKHSQIAPMFKERTSNVRLPEEFNSLV
jgi:hypothetical protein